MVLINKFICLFIMVINKIIFYFLDMVNSIYGGLVVVFGVKIC